MIGYHATYEYTLIKVTNKARKGTDMDEVKGHRNFLED